MRPAIDESAAGLSGAALAAEGAGYATALLDRIAAGASSADDLVGLIQFLGTGQMLHGASAVLFMALRVAAEHLSHTDGGPHVQTPAHRGCNDAR